MLTLDLAPTQLEPLLARLLAPRVAGVRCRVVGAGAEAGRPSAAPGSGSAAGARLALVLERVDTGLVALGRTLPRLDVELALGGRLLADGRVELAWSIERVAPLPAFVARALPLEGAVKRALAAQLERLGLEHAVQLGPGSLALDPRRLALGPLGEGWLACTSFALPAGELALAARLVLAPPPGQAGAYAARPPGAPRDAP